MTSLATMSHIGRRLSPIRLKYSTNKIYSIYYDPDQIPAGAAVRREKDGEALLDEISQITTEDQKPNKR